MEFDEIVGISMIVDEDEGYIFKLQQEGMSTQNSMRLPDTKAQGKKNTSVCDNW